MGLTRYVCRCNGKYFYDNYHNLPTTWGMSATLPA